MSYLKIKHSDIDENACITDLQTAMNELDALLSDGEPGATVTIELVEMTEEEFDELDEFQGW